VLAYLCAVADEFVCHQWESKVVNTDIYFYVECNIGPEAIVCHSAVGISS
jgi:hypothetical protein